jgi:carbon storage regulator
MIVVSRKIGEAIIIGDKIHISLVAILGEEVRLGIVVPAEVSVDRLEIHDNRNPLPNAEAEPETDQPFPC